ncbi:MAG: hypothetical protein P1T08_18390 [Acidimicrobiia bacterium]|nr:hypothetical protein [Acidimicrobiia bacterium]
MARAIILRAPLAAILACTALFVGCSDTTNIPVVDLTSCDDLFDVAIESVIRLRSDSATITERAFLLVEPEAEAAMQAYLNRRDEVRDRARHLGCDMSDLDERYRSRVLELAPETEGGLMALANGFHLGPFAP